MKVYQINCDSGCYSTGKIASDLALSLINSGHESIVAYGRDYKDVGVPTYKIGTHFGVYIHAGLSRIFDSCGLHSVIATKKLINHIKEYNPDIIHLHNIHGYYLNYKVLFNFLSKYNKPVVWTLHDCWAFTGHCAHFELAHCYKWKSCCNNCSCLNKYPRSIFDFSRRNYKIKRKMFSNLDNLTIVTPSEWLANYVAESFLSKNKIEVINNGIDTEVFIPKKTQIFEKYLHTTKKILLAVASSWSEEKGLLDYYKLADCLGDEYLIFMIGLKKEQISKLPKNMFGIEKTFNVSDLVEMYSSAYAFINFTYEDNYPTVNLEAQACGLPVITYKTGGSPESCLPEQCIEKGDILSVSKLLKEQLRVNMKQDFSKERMLDKYLQLYERILNDDNSI